MNLTVKVIPRAHKNEIVSFDNNLLKVRLTAVPEKGEANELLIEFLAESLHCSKSLISIVRGKASRTKLVHIEGDETQIVNCLKKII